MRSSNHLVIIPKRLLWDAGRLEVETEYTHALLFFLGQELFQVFWLEPVDPVQSRAAKQETEKNTNMPNIYVSNKT